MARIETEVTMLKEAHKEHPDKWGFERNFCKTCMK